MGLEAAERREGSYRAGVQERRGTPRQDSETVIQGMPTNSAPGDPSQSQLQGMRDADGVPIGPCVSARIFSIQRHHLLEQQQHLIGRGKDAESTNQGSPHLVLSQDRTLQRGDHWTRSEPGEKTTGSSCASQEPLNKKSKKSGIEKMLHPWALEEADMGQPSCSRLEPGHRPASLGG